MDAKKTLMDRIDAEMQNLNDRWASTPPEKLVDEAHFIAATQDAYKFLSDRELEPREISLLLQSATPLQYVADWWDVNMTDWENLAIAFSDALINLKSEYEKEDVMMDDYEMTEILYNKMAGEQKLFENWLRKQPAQEAMDRSYELTVRKDILNLLKNATLPGNQAWALLTSPCPLADVYKEFSRMETGYMDVIQESIDGCASRLMEKHRKSKDEPQRLSVRAKLQLKRAEVSAPSPKPEKHSDRGER